MLFVVLGLHTCPMNFMIWVCDFRGSRQRLSPKLSRGEVSVKVCVIELWALPVDVNR